MADAKARAAQLAKDAGTTLDGPITISESINNGPVPFYAARDSIAPSAAGAPVPVQSGQVSVQIQVSVTYQMH